MLELMGDMLEWPIVHEIGGLVVAKSDLEFLRLAALELYQTTFDASNGASQVFVVVAALLGPTLKCQGGEIVGERGLHMVTKGAIASFGRRVGGCVMCVMFCVTLSPVVVGIGVQWIARQKGQRQTEAETDSETPE